MATATIITEAITVLATEVKTGDVLVTGPRPLPVIQVQHRGDEVVIHHSRVTRSTLPAQAKTRVKRQMIDAPRRAAKKVDEALAATNKEKVAAIEAAPAEIVHTSETEPASRRRRATRKTAPPIAFSGAL